MPTNEKKPRRTFDREFFESAVKLLSSEGYSLTAAAKVVNVSHPTLRQRCQKHAAQNDAAAAKLKLTEMKEVNRQLRPQTRQAEPQRKILKKATACLAKESQ